MSVSWTYRSPFFYEVLMRAIYGHRYSTRFRSVADLIPENASVLDLCCGPGTLYSRYLRHKGVRYTGLDVNPTFIAQVNRSGAQGQVWNLFNDTPLPPADYVVMLGGLLHFMPDPAPIVDRMLQAARKQVIICEPIRSLAKSRLGPIAWIASRSTDAGLGAVPQRFTDETLSAFFSSYAQAHRIDRSFYIPGGRDKVYVLNKELVRNSPSKEGSLSDA